MVRRVLNVAEKPSAAKEIVGILGRSTQVSNRQGFSPYNRIYEFDMQLEAAPAHMVFTSVTGHLKGSDFEQRYRKWGSCDPAILLDRNATRVEWAVMDDKEPLRRTLQQEARRADWLVLWLDCDSEGEKIAADVRDVCVAARASLVVKRARFSAMTRGDLLRAINHLDVLNEKIAAMVCTRQEIDLRAGSAYTRFLTTTLEAFNLGSAARSGGSRSIVSYGPCQFPTLGLVVDRWLTIQQFVRRPFWVFDLKLVGTPVPFDWKRKHIFDEYTANLLYELVVEQAEAEGSVVHVERVERKNKSRWRPLPLATVDLQKSASRSLRMSSDRVMEIAESLYTKGLISYPRTETDKFGHTYDLKSFIVKQTSHPEWGGFASRLLTPPTQEDIVTFGWPRNGNKDDGAHPPIHPTESAPPQFDSEDHQKLYMYITKRFLACCSVDARGSETTVQVRVGEAEYFTARGLIVEHRGWLEVMHSFEKWSEREMPVALLSQGATLPYESLILRKSMTQPPPLLSESDLISLMDHYGIGTDATIAEHIKKVQERNYVIKNAGRFSPSEIGISLVTAHERCQLHLARPHMRADQERDLKRISSGQANATTVLESALQDYRSKFDQLRGNTETLRNEFQNRFQEASASTWSTLIPNLSECGVCHGMMDLKGDPNGGTSGGGTGRGRGRRRGHASGGDGAGRMLHCRSCDKSHKLPRFGNIARHNVHCPICGFQSLEFTNTTKKTSHTLCPHCVNKPPDSKELNPEGKTNDFRCFMCAHPTCANSGGDRSSICKCPKCGSDCRLREARKTGSPFISCEKGRDCSFVYWFPKDVLQSWAAADGVCARCSSRNIRLEWKRGRMAPGTSPVFVGCIWCDAGYTDALARAGLEREIPKPPHPGNRDAMDIEDGGQSRTSGRGRGLGRGRGTVRGRAITWRGRGRGSFFNR